MTCLCTGSCMNGGICSAFPKGRQALGNQYVPNFDSPKINISTDYMMHRINAQEHTINEIHKSIKKIEYVLGDVFKEGNPIKIMQKETEKKPYQNIFEFIAVDPKRRDDIRYIKNTMHELYCWILDNIQDNKWRSKGIESLEESAMWLNKSISRRKENGTQT